MKKAIVILAAGLLATTLHAQTPRWIRHSSISPDAQTVAFSYQGDIFTVPATGGEAKQLTINPAYDSDPIFTPDGKNIVFSSYRELSKDIFIIPTEGGTPKRLTTFTGSETPLCCTADKIYFKADIQQESQYGEFPGTAQLYSVGYNGGKITLESPICAENMSVNSNGIRIYEDNKGYEDDLRKHHTSSVTRDIWKYLPKKNTYTKLTSFNGEDRNPVFESSNSTVFYYLSEQSGSFNVWKSDINATSEPVQITTFLTHPVRNLSASQTGVLLFSHNGDLYTQSKGNSAKKLEIILTKDETQRETVRRNISSGISAMSVSPDGKEIAVVAHGDVFVINPELEITKRITNTPEQERNVCFSEDSRTLYYSAERDGEWAIWSSSLTSGQDYFSLENNFKEERLTKAGTTCFQPQVSPDGKYIAYLQERNNLVVKNLASGKEKDLLKDVNYSYSDGDLEFEWSPDSKYILTTYMGEGGWNNSDIAVVEVATGKVQNISQSGYSDHGFHWIMGGKGMVWHSDKNGYRSHGSWGSEDDLYAMFFTEDSYKEFTQSKEDKKIVEAHNTPRKEKEGDKKDDKKDTKKEIKPNFENLRERTVRINPFSGGIGDFMVSEDAKTIWFFMQINGKTNLCKIEKEEPSEVKIIRKDFYGSFASDSKQKNVFISSGRGIYKFDTKSDKVEPVTFKSEYDYNSAKERAYIFSHIWKQVNEKFYDPGIHGLNWSAIGENYRQFLPYINNNYDFRELLSEMLGELNGSHTGGRYYPGNSLNTGHIGILWDTEYKGDGLKVAEVLPGCKLATAYPDVKAGCVLQSIDGKEIGSGTNWYDAFENKAGKMLTLKFKGIKDDCYVTAGWSDSRALYTRWVKQREKMVEELSGGKVGYVHVEGMDSESFREVFQNALGKYRNCEALIVDTRHNGGGWLTDDLIDFLSGKEYLQYIPRGRYIGSDPFNKWCRPSCVLVGEDNYSDAAGFPYAYQALGIGKLIGAPVPGTMTAVWWERQIDPTIVFGIPQVTTVSVAKQRPLENMQIEPDIVVYNTPESLLLGKDLQLEAAVKEMLKEISK